MILIKVNSGNDIQAKNLGSAATGYSGTSSNTTVPTATTLTDSGAPGWTVNGFAGQNVSTGTVWGQIISNTASTVTIDRWYTTTTPGGAAGGTPAGNIAYNILPLPGPAAPFMGLTANATAPAATDTTLTGEITTAGGGLVRKICPFAHTAGAASYTLTPVYTANGSDSLPVTIAKIGVFDSMVVGTAATMLFETTLSTTATLSASGDQLTITETVSM